MSVVKPVVRLIRNHHQKKTLSLTLLGTTALHPFYVRGHGWVKAGGLHTGDEIVSEEGHVLKVRRVQQCAGLADTYNFEVADTHTYFVGTLHAWVHNDCKNNGEKDGEPKKWSIKGHIKDTGLPTRGKVRFVPDSKYQTSNPLLKENNGYLDRFGNIWKKGPSRTQGEAV